MERRKFLKVMGTAGLGSAFAGAKAAFASAENKTDANEPGAAEKEQKPKLPQVAKRKFGKTGVKIPCLALGGIREPMVLRQALEWGLNYWDTSLVAAGGNSEISIGKYLEKNPQVRKKLFIATKESDSKNAADLETCLQTSLKRMNTEYIDLYFGVYRMHDPAQLTDEVKQWAKDAKKRKLIRFFGFTTHKNIDQCLLAAAKAGWIDAIMLAYNFRLMQDPKIAAAIEACHKAKIGLVVMKTQGMGQKVKSDKDRKVVGHFLQRGFSEGQAKIKAVLENEMISSACVAMSSNALLVSNVAAVLDKTKLTKEDMNALSEYAAATCSSYCAGCANVCDSVLKETPYVSDAMRYLMYYNSYGERDRARELFAQIPGEVRNKLLSTDYSTAEARCPQHLPIAKLMAEAVSKLA